MTSKLRVKAGPVELDYEGDSSFSPESLKDLLSHIHLLFGGSIEDHAPATNAIEATVVAPVAGGAAVQMHVNTIAARLESKTGPELAIAAAAYLQMVRGKEKFLRKEMLETMKEATSYYNDTYSSNLSAILKSLVRQKKLNQISQDTYALTASERGELGMKLVE